MLLAARRPPERVRVRLTAMIDVVFLLIIFFMTVSQISQDTKEELPLPVAEHGQLVRDRHGRFVLNVRQDGSVIVAGRVLTTAGLQEALRRTVAQEGADEVVCVLRVDRQTPFRSVQLLLADLAEAGVWRLAYSVVEED